MSNVLGANDSPTYQALLNQTNGQMDISVIDSLTVLSYLDVTSATVVPAVLNEIKDNLQVSEVQQLENINGVTINNTQWSYLGELDQSLTKTSDVEFNSVTVPTLSSPDIQFNTATEYTPGNGLRFIGDTSNYIELKNDSIKSPVSNVLYLMDQTFGDIKIDQSNPDGLARLYMYGIHSNYITAGDAYLTTSYSTTASIKNLVSNPSGTPISVQDVLEVDQINPQSGSAVGISNLQIVSNKLESTSGNLTLDSFTGNIHVDANLMVADISERTGEGGITLNNNTIIINSAKLFTINIESSVGNDLTLTPAIGQSIVLNGAAEGSTLDLSGLFKTDSIQPHTASGTITLTGDLDVVGDLDVTGALTVGSFGVANLAVDNIISNTTPNGNITINPDGTGVTIVDSTLKTDNITSKTTGGNLQLGPISGIGHVYSLNKIVAPTFQIASHGVSSFEYGSYSPTIGDSSYNFTGGLRKGSYWRLGELCFVCIQLYWTGKSSATSTIRISLPFTAGAGATGWARTGVSFGYISGVYLPTGYTMHTGGMSPGLTYFVPQGYHPATGATANLTAVAHFATVGEYQCSLFYSVA